MLLGDALENRQVRELAEISQNADRAEAVRQIEQRLPRLSVLTHLKWAALALASGALGLLYLRQGASAVAWLGFAAAALVVVGLALRRQEGIVQSTAGLGAFWLAAMIYAVRVIRGSG